LVSLQLTLSSPQVLGLSSAHTAALLTTFF
jgi:hypothetical protein